MEPGSLVIRVKVIEEEKGRILAGLGGYRLTKTKIMHQQCGATKILQ